MKRIIISLAVDIPTRTRYQNAIRRLRRSVHAHSTDDSRFYINKCPVGCPKHDYINYAFKPYIINLARRTHDQVLWIDSACILQHDPKPIWDIIDAQGYYLQKNGWSPGEWMTDRSLELMEVTRDEACDMTLLMANVMGFDFTSQICCKYFDRWLNLSRNKDIFNGDWKNDKQQCSLDPRCLGHRHDQSVASVIANQMGLAITICAEQKLLMYAHPGDKGSEEYIILAAGA